MKLKTVHVTSMLIVNLMVIAVIAFGAAPHVKRSDAAPAGKAPAQDASATLVTQGHNLFLTNCAACHGADAQGDDGPNLHRRGLSDTAIAAAIAKGFPGEMPAFGGKLKAAQTQTIAAYVRSLQK